MNKLVAISSVLAVSSVSADSSLYKRCPVLDQKAAAKTSFLQKYMVPGTGADLDKVKAGMNQVYKDGYYEVGCINDGMRVNADKHGEGKFKYAAQNLNVSIVWYNSLVDKIDREEMTHEVCYNFCRRVDGMSFFGIQNGRDCYCTPYYKQVVGGGSEDCDMPCDGNPSMMCGGQTKSSVFQMHWCGDVADNLKSATTLLTEKRLDLSQATDALRSCKDNLQIAGEMIQKVQAKNGDKWAGDDGQNAKKAAGVYNKIIQRSEKAAAAAQSEEGESRKLQSSDPKDPSNAKAAEDTLAKLDVSEVQVLDAQRAVTDATNSCQADSMAGDLSKFAALYFPVTKYVADGFRNATSTCNGEEIGAPSFRSDLECAALCSETVSPSKCMAYQSYMQGPKGVCVLFSSVTDVSYYSGENCPTQRGPSASATCKVKASESTGFAAKNGVNNEQRCFQA